MVEGRDAVFWMGEVPRALSCGKEPVVNLATSFSLFLAVHSIPLHTLSSLRQEDFFLRVDEFTQRADISFTPIEWQVPGGGRIVASCDSSQIAVVLEIGSVDGWGTAYVNAEHFAMIVIVPRVSAAPLIKRPGESDPGLNAYESSLP
jgi:hypothetical protein